jgi:hypothetical protein
VLEALETYWLSGVANATLRSVRGERPILLGEDEVGAAVSLPGTALASRNLGVFGDSGTGKSWVTGLLAEGMHRAGYQVLLIDPEGDYRGMRALPKIVALDGNLITLPPPLMVVALLEKISVSVVLDLCSYPVDHRERYVAELLRELRSLKARMFRPHWVVLEEAQYFLPPNGNSVSDALLPMLPDGGWAFITYRPDRMAAPVLASLDYCLLTRLSESGAVRHLHRWFNMDEQSPADIPAGHAWLCGQGLVHLHPGTRRVPHIRHLHKYLDVSLPPHKRFYFRDENGSLGIEAASLFEFQHCLSDLSLESLTYHHTRGDFAAWAADALGDRMLAAQLRKLARRSLEGESLRAALVKCVASHYAELHALP